MNEQMTAVRRMGPKGSQIWHAMLDAAEDILQDQGYGELTSRRLAERVGVKQRLIYYYFATMDELIVETFQRLAAREIECLTQAAASSHALREIWKVFGAAPDIKLVSEFCALANRIEALRREVKAHIEICRSLKVTALRRAIAATGRRSSISPLAAAILADAIALALHREAAVGVSEGHADVLALIADFISRHESTE